MNKLQQNTNKMSSKKYVYFINYRIGQKELCIMEMKAIFNVSLSRNIIISDLLIDPSLSTFINGRLDIINQGNSLTNLEQNILAMNLSFDQYKIKFINLGDYTEYSMRLKALRMIGFAIEGAFAIKNPLISLALTKIENKWIFGYYTKNNNEWLSRKKKPFNYSYAIDVQLAKTLINIATRNNNKLKLVDPCCGIGTILIEGKIQGIDIKGFDFNEIVVNKCNGNLKYFSLDEDAVYQDMLTITKTYDVAILDIPYGQFSLTSLKEQKALINKTKSLANEAVIISMEDLEEVIVETGFSIIDRCKVTKSNSFSRFVYSCK